MEEGYTERQNMRRVLPRIKHNLHRGNNPKHSTSRIPLQFRLLRRDSHDVAASIARQMRENGESPEEDLRYKGFKGSISSEGYSSDNQI